MTITEAHEQLKNKKISCTELVQSCLDQIEKHNDTLNVVVHYDAEKALAEAKKMDDEGKFDHPLKGIPYMPKDNFCEAGVPSVACSNILRDQDYVPPYDSTTIARLRKAGAISIGRANTDEFTMGASSETSCFGPSLNPYDSTKVAGGSSGGSAAGLAAGMCLFSLGTDTGGSIRLPAAFCNVCSIKPTYGRTSRFGVMSMASSLDTIGALANTVEDLAIVLETISGSDEHDKTTTEKDVPNYPSETHGDIKGMKIGLPKEYFIDGIHPEVEEAIKNAAATYEKLGAEVQEISLPHTKYAVATYCVITPCEVSSNMARYDGIRYGHEINNAENLVDHYHKVRTEGFGDEVKRRVMIGTYALSAGYYDQYYRKAQRVRTLIKQDFDEAFKTVDVIMAPTSPTLPFEPGAHANDPVAMFLEDIFLDAQPLAGIPAMNIPCAFSKCQAEPGRSLPIGMQLIGPQWSEATIFKTASAYEVETKVYERRAEV